MRTKNSLLSGSYLCVSSDWFGWKCESVRDLITTTSPFSVPFLKVSDLPIISHRVSDLFLSPLLYELKYYVKCLIWHNTLPSIRVRSFGVITYFRLYDERVHLFSFFSLPNTRDTLLSHSLWDFVRSILHRVLFFLYTHTLHCLCHLSCNTVY